VELTAWLRKYWSLILVAMGMGYVGYRLLPNTSVDPNPDLLLSGLVQETEPEAKEKAPSSDKVEGRDDLKQAQLKTPSLLDRLQPRPRVAIVEVPRLVSDTEQVESAPRTLTQDSPEVRAALTSTEIAIYAAAEAAETQELVKYLSHNGLHYALHDTQDAMEQERARRLAGNGEGTVIVVDGQVLRGHSQAQLDELLLTAIKKRIEP
jgi:hypothetical protein